MRTILLSFGALLAARAEAAWVTTQGTGCQAEIPGSTTSLRAAWDGECRVGKVEGRGLLRISDGGRIEGVFRAGKPVDAEGQSVRVLVDGLHEMQRVAYRGGVAAFSPLIDDPNLMRLDIRSIAGRHEWRFLEGGCQEIHEFEITSTANVRSRDASVDYLVQLFALKRPGHWMMLARTATGGNGRADCVDVALTTFGETRRLFLQPRSEGGLRVCMEPKESTCFATLTPVTRTLITSAINPARGLAGGNGTISGAPGTTGSAAAIDLVLDRNKGALYALYGRALRENDKLAGKVVFEITLAADGSVTDCRIVSSELSDPELERKLVARIRLIRFGPQAGPGTFRKTIDFFPAA